MTGQTRCRSPLPNLKPESEGANPTTSGKKFEWDNYLIGSFLMQKLDLDVQENRFTPTANHPTAPM